MTRIDVDSKATGKRIRELMNKNGISKKRLAYQVGYHPGVIARWLRGGNIPNVLALYSMSRAFNCKIADILVIKNEKL